MLGEAANRTGVVTPMGLPEYVAARLQEDGRQVPVWKGEQVGLVILGSGFQALNPLTIEEAGLDPDLVEDVAREADEHMSAYLEKMAVPYDQWKTRGFLESSRLLEPVLRWFDRHVLEYPALSSHPRFREAHSEARARLSQLGTISEGILTNNGRVDTHIGAGAFGTVWKVVEGSGKTTAYKIYHPAEIYVKEKVARFERGYRAMKQLDHPNVVKVREYTSCPIGFFMDFIDGPNLRQFAGTLTDPSDILGMLLTIGETLQHAHGRNVIHRDVKPENIIAHTIPILSRGRHT